MRIVLAILFGLLAFNAQAQDRIIKNNKDTITGYIAYENNDVIRYRTSTDRSTPLQNIDKFKVAKVVYADGTEKIYTLDRPLDFDFRNRAEWVFTDVFLASFSVAYERLSKNHLLGYRIPISVSPFRQMAGLDFRIYPTTALGKLKFFFGPQFRVGYNGSGIADLFNTNYINTSYSSVFTTLTFANGISYSTPKGLNLSMYAGIGVRMAWYNDGGDFLYYNEPLFQDYPLADRIAPQLRFGITIGKNF